MGMKRYKRDWMINARNSLNLSQEQLAEACHCDPSYIWHIEAGSKTPNVHLGLQITQVLGLNPYSWLDEKRIA